jgi:hypothetical protein
MFSDALGSMTTFKEAPDTFLITYTLPEQPEAAGKETVMAPPVLLQMIV